MVLASFNKFGAHHCAASAQHLCDLIYIIGKGIPTIARSTWKIAAADPAKVNPRSIIWHASAVGRAAREFRLSVEFVRRNPIVANAIQEVAMQQGSRWKVQPDMGQPLAAGAQLIKVDSLKALGEAIVKERVFQNGSVRGYAVPAQ